MPWILRKITNVTESACSGLSQRDWSNINCYIILYAIKRKLEQEKIEVERRKFDYLENSVAIKEDYNLLEEEDYLFKI